MASPYLQIADIQASQNQKEVTANAAIAALDKAMNGAVSIAVTVSFDLTTTQTRENGCLILTGTPGVAFTMDMPDTNDRLIAVLNNTDAAVTVRNSVGAGADQPIIASGDAAVFQYDGTDFHIIYQTPTAADAQVYDFGVSFGATPVASDVLGRVRIGRNITIPANMAGSSGGVAVNPTATFDIAVLQAGVQIGTISVSTLGVVTFTTTSGLLKQILAGDEITFVAPATPDTTVESGSFIILATMD